MYKKNLDDLSIKLLNHIKSGVEGKTMKEVMGEVGIDHPQKLYNRLEKLIKNGFIDEDYNYIKGIESMKLYLPFFGWAQCGNNGKHGTIEDYPMKRIDIDIINVDNIKAENFQNYFITRAKGKSMEPKIKTGDNLLLKKYNGENISTGKQYLISHNGKAKIKKILLTDTGYTLISLNREYPPVEVTENDDSFFIIGQVDRKINI